MKIIVSQNNKKILITFKDRKIVDNYTIDKSDRFLNVLDIFINNYKINTEVFRKTNFKFVNVGVLTERIIRAIIAGLRF